MKSTRVRIAIELPRDLHRRLQEATARKGCSVQQLILMGIDHAIKDAESSRPKGRLALDPPLIKPAGRRIRISNRKVYEIIQLP